MGKSVKGRSRKIKTRRRTRGGAGLKLVKVGDEFILTEKNTKRYIKRFREYNCGACELTEFPDVSEIPKETKKLILGSNQITEIPDSIGKLTNLVELDLNDNQINKISPEIGKLTNLKILYLNNNNITSLPPEIGNLTNLEELYVHNNPQLETLPAELAKLPKLKTPISVGNNYEWLDDAVVKKFGNKLEGPIPNQDWNTKMNSIDFRKQNDDEPFISEKLNTDVANKIFSYLPLGQQRELIKSRNINKGGRKTRRRKSIRKKSRRHR
jgi:Leucine-rich repeat (LRR) protein